MALARIELVEGRSREQRRAMVEAVATALTEVLKAPANDPSVRLIEYRPEDFVRPYPERHSDAFTLVEVTMFEGRSAGTKRHLYEAIVESLSACGIPADDILIVVHEPPLHNWAVKGGVPANEVDLGFEIGI